MRMDHSLPNNSFVLSNGSLLLTNISSENEGIYICTATNVLGRTVAMTGLHLSGQKAYNSTEDLSRKGKRRVFMASSVGTSVSGKAGDLLRIGCPVQTSHQNTIHWFLRKQPIEEMKGFKYRILVSGRVLEINSLSEQSTGEYRCWTSNNSKTMSAWVNVSLEVYSLEYGEWTPCSTSCGNMGSQVRTQHCVNSEGQRVDNSLCEHLQPLTASPQSCNIQDCPIRWATSSWSECSASCGTGFQLRQVACQQLMADGSVKVLALNYCGLTNRPAAKKPCVTDACVDWVPQPWGQCFNRCTGQGMGLQHRHIVCQNRNGTVVPDTYCDRRKRPASRRDCSSEMCDVYWRTGPWRPCTAACGNGFQSRKVDCVHRKNGKVLADQYCVWKRRPMTWQRCNITSCGSMQIFGYYNH